MRSKALQLQDDVEHRVADTKAGSVRFAGRALTLALAFIALMGCETGKSVSWDVDFGQGVNSARVSTLELIVRRGGCASTDVVYSAVLTRGQNPSDVGALESTRYGFAGNALDASCTTLASTCAEFDLSSTGVDVVSLVLEQVPEQPCEGVCSGGQCSTDPPSDAGLDVGPDTGADGALETGADTDPLEAGRDADDVDAGDVGTDTEDAGADTADDAGSEDASVDATEDATEDTGSDTAPAVEVCDGLDNDTDGDIDEDLPSPEPCDLDGGLCPEAAGMTFCSGPSGWVCEPVTSADDSCDGVDQDCDGRIDESVSDACPSPGCALRGTATCDDGALLCSAGERDADGALCDGMDNDCDGVVDEDNCEVSLPAGDGTSFCRGYTRVIRGTSRYFLACQYRTREKARRTCDQLGARLVIIDSEEAFDTLVSIAQTRWGVSSSGVWVGAIYQAGVGQLRWDDGTPVEGAGRYTPGPISGPSMECMQLLPDGDPRYRMHGCSMGGHRYICEL